MLTQKTKATKSSEIERAWFVIDAEGQVLGRLATRVAALLMGKGKTYFARHLDCGDHVVVINAGKIKVTGNKLTDKVYHRHTGYIGGIKSITLEKQLQEKPERVITAAVSGMIPKNRLGRQMMTKLKVYRGGEHPHEAQLPQEIKL